MADAHAARSSHHNSSRTPPPPTPRDDQSSKQMANDVVERISINLSKCHIETQTQISNLEKAQQARHDTLSNQVSDLGKDFKAMAVEVDKVKNDVKGLHDKTDAQEARLSKLEERLSCYECSEKELRKRLAIAESADPVPLPTNEFDRVPSREIVRINAQSYVSRVAVQAAVEKLARDANIDTATISIKGKAVDKWFVVQFKGAPDISSRHVRTILDSIKLEDGKWVRVMASEDGKKEVQIFLGPDKSKKQIRTEVLTKKLVRIFESQGVKDIDANRWKGQVMVSWQPIALVQVLSKDEAELLFDAEYCKTLKIDKDAIRSLFMAETPTRSPLTTQWSS